MRCSQTKLTCSRCAKNRITCVYGLSRRSHPAAPRVGETLPTSSTTTTLDIRVPNNTTNNTSSSIPPPNLSHPFDFDLYAEDTTILSGISYSSPSPSMQEYFQDHAALTGVDAGLSGFWHPPKIDKISPSNHQISANNVKFSQPNPSLPSPHPSGSSDDVDSGTCRNTGRSPGPTLGTQKKRPRLEIKNHACNCRTAVISKITNIPSKGGGDHASFDIQLSQLREAIRTAETCLQCDCHSNVMVAGILIGHIIGGFEVMMPKVRCSVSPSDQYQDSARQEDPGDSKEGGGNVTTDIGTRPKISWGTLRIDDCEEDELKWQICLLSFRRLEDLIKRFGRFGRPMTMASHGASGGVEPGCDGPSNPAYAMACGSIHMWLEQKLQVARDASWSLSQASPQDGFSRGARRKLSFD